MNSPGLKDSIMDNVSYQIPLIDLFSIISSFNALWPKKKAAIRASDIYKHFSQ